jgi:hypothetical protein
MFLIYELFFGLSRGEETFVFGKCYGFMHDHPWIELPGRSVFPPSFSHSAPLPLVARMLELGLARCREWLCVRKRCVFLLPGQQEFEKNGSMLPGKELCQGH